MLLMSKSKAAQLVNGTNQTWAGNEGENSLTFQITHNCTNAGERP